ncbi:MAG: regulatory protein RecX [Niabella sp.]
MSPSSLTPEQALQKLRQFCAYRERCHAEVTDKLYNLDVWKKDHDEIIATLIEENYLNEERFAEVFAGGHFRQKQWGRNKIVQALKQKQISPYCIKKALLQIDEDAYHNTLHKLVTAKWQSLRSERDRFVKMRKTSDYLLQKGYEPEFVREVVSGME